MSKSILIAGKDLPEASNFADGAEIKMRNIVISNSPEVKSVVATNIKTLPWLKTSPVSARTLVLDCETIFEKLDEAVLYFDESYYAAKFNSLTMQCCSQALDEAVLGYQYLALEILSRFEKRMTLYTEGGVKSKLAFLIKRTANEYDVKKSPSLRSDVPMASGPFTAAATAAFQAFAENIAAIYSGREYVDIVLASADINNETAKLDRTLAEWLCGYMDDLDLPKNRPSIKQSLSWIKAGSKGAKFLLF